MISKRKEIYAEVTFGGVTVYAPNKGKYGVWETSYFSLDAEIPKFKNSYVILVANLQKTAIRIAELPERIKKSRELPETPWELVQQNFPIGDKMNEKTHVFDGGEFWNAAGQGRFFMSALPMEVSDLIAKIGVDLTGSVNRLVKIDTVEHMLARQYCGTTAAKDGGLLVFLPQENSLRILFIADELPQAVFKISGNPNFNMDELHRGLNSLDLTTDTKTVFLYSKYEHIPKWLWVHEILQKKGISIEEKPFCLLLYYTKLGTSAIIPFTPLLKI